MARALSETEVRRAKLELQLDVLVGVTESELAAALLAIFLVAAEEFGPLIKAALSGSEGRL